MPIGYRDSASNYINSGTTLDVVLPGTIQAGDCIAVMGVLHLTSVGDPSLSGGGGAYTAYGPTDDSNLRTKLFKRVATAGDIGATLTLSWTSACKALLLVWIGSGTNTTDPFDDTPATTVESGTSATHTCPGVTPSAAGCWIVEFCIDRPPSASVTASAPAGRTERAEQFGSGSAGPSGIVADSNGTVTAGVASGVKTYTFDQAASNAVGWSIAIAPQPSPAAPHPSVVPAAAPVRAARW